MQSSKKDFIYASFTGFYSGLIAWQILDFLNISIGPFGGVCDRSPLSGVCPTPDGISWFWLMIIVPIIWIIGVNFGYFLGKWMPFFNQFGRFAAIGFTNFIVSTGTLNIFIAYSGITSGTWYSVFVTVAFLVGAMHSYAWNKFWVFSAQNSVASGGEFLKFFIVNGIAGLINVGVASFIVNVMHPLLGITPEGWANVGAIAGSAIGLIFSFIGFRLLVFKNNAN